jgi:3-oxoacyl-[acyl-carrier-protein] synthase II
MSRRIVVTGMGALTPIGNNMPAYLEGLQTGKSGAATITRFDATGFRTTFACEIKISILRIFLIKRNPGGLTRFPSTPWSLLTRPSRIVG